MRQSRVKTRRESKQYNTSLVFLFVILLPIVSIFLGYLATKHYIIPSIYSEKSDTESISLDAGASKVDDATSQSQSSETKAQEAFVNSFEMVGLDIYSIQIGKFSTMDHAQSLQREMLDKGFESYIYEDNGYKVLTLTLCERDTLDLQMDRIKEHYSDAFVHKISIPTRALRYTKSDSKYSVLLSQKNEELVALFQSLSMSIASYMQQKSSAEQLNQSVGGSIEVLRGMKEVLAKELPSKNLEHIHKDFLMVMDIILNDLEGIRKASDKELEAKISNILSSGLYQYLQFSKLNN